MLSCRGNDLTNSAFTVSIEVISFGSSARRVSFRYCRNTSPIVARRKKKSSSNEGEGFVEDYRGSFGRSEVSEQRRVEVKGKHHEVVKHCIRLHSLQSYSNKH